MKKKYTFIIMIFLIIFACETLEDAKIFNTNDKVHALISDIEILIIQYDNSGNSGLLKKAKSIIDELSALSENSRLLKAKVMGLSAMLSYYQHDNVINEETIKKIQFLNKNEEYLFIIQAYLSENPAERGKILNEGLKKADTKKFIKLHLGLNYFQLTDYKKSVELFDEAFTELPEIIKNYYKITRDIAFKFLTSPPKNKNTAAMLLNKKMTYNDLIQIINNESNLFVKIFNTSDFDEIVKNLNEGKYFFDSYRSDINLNSIVKRKDYAYFTVKILAKAENNPSLLNKYINENTSSQNPSYLKDVKINEYYYNAALILIEREIMEMPDGENFFPEAGISGISVYEGMLKTIR